MGCRNRLDFSVGDQNWLHFSVGTGIDLVLCGGRKWLGLESGSRLTWHQCWGRNLAFVWGIEIDFVLVWGSKLTWFLCGGQNWLGFCLRAENDLFLVWGSIDLVFVLVEIDLFLYAGRKSLGISVRIEICLVFVWVVEILTWFQCRDEIDLVVVWVAEIALISV